MNRLTLFSLLALSLLLLFACDNPMQGTDPVSDAPDAPGNAPPLIATVFVSPAGDDSNDGTTAESAVRTIGTAIDLVESGGEIRVATGEYRESISIFESVLVRGSFTPDFSGIDPAAPSSIIDPSHPGPGGRAITIGPCDVELHGLVIRNGVDEMAGGLLIGGSADATASLLVSGCAITGNEATGWGGGGISAGYATVEVENSTISDNTASRPIDSNGGAINIGGDSTLIVRDSLISGNSCAGNAGGAIFLGEADGTFIDTVFLSNSGPSHGGGINAWEGMLTVTDCEFTDNEVITSGGAISVGPSPDYYVTLAGTTFSGNTPNDISGSQVDASIVYDGIAPAAGDVYDLVTLTGSGFGTGPGGAYSLVLAGTTGGGTGVMDELVESWSDTSIEFRIPTVSTVGDYYVQLVTGAPSNVPGVYPTFTVESLATTDPPQTTSVSPPSASPGDEVTMTGTSYRAASGAISVGGTACEIVSWSDAQVIFALPDGIESRVAPYDIIITPIASSMVDSGGDVSVKPDVPLCTSTDSGAVVLAGETVSGATRYELLRALTVDGAYAEVASSATTTMTDSTAEEETTYFYRYRGAATAAGPLSDAIEVQTTMNTDPPSTPTGVTVDASTATSVSLSWDTVARTTSYVVYRSDGETSAYAQIATPSSPSYTDGGLSAATTYYYKVAAVNSYGESAATAPSAASTAGVAPSTPAGLAVDATTTTSVSLSWSTSSGATSYVVYRSGSETGTYVQIGTPTSLSFTDTGLAAATTYYYAVAAVNSYGESARGDPLPASTSGTAPVTPGGLEASSVTYSQVTVVWDAVSDATGYTLYRATSSGGAYSAIRQTTGTMHTDSAVSAGSTYFYRVSASNADGESAPSDPIEVLTEPGIPTGLTVTATTSDSVSFSWNVLTGASGYVVYRYDGSSTYVQIGTTTGSTSYTDTGLEGSTDYRYYVTGVNATGEGYHSSTLVATTEAAYEAKAASGITDGTYVFTVDGASLTYVFSTADQSCSYSDGVYSYGGGYSHNPTTGVLNITVSRSQDFGAGVVMTMTINQYYNAAFTTDGGSLLYLGATEKTSGVVGELTGTYSSVFNMSIVTSVSGTTQTGTYNQTTTWQYNANGTYSGSAVMTGTTPSTTTMSGTWTDNGDGTVTQVQAAPSASTSTYTPYWVSAFGKEYLAPSNGAYVRQ